MSSRHRSPDMFIGMYGNGTKTAYVVHDKDMRAGGKVTYVPIYMAVLL